ncbi:MAG: phosphate/phosphite/phosphonate ABC transporter substrate-binding protein [Planctomycetota bacterium]|nr:phosphate/phosphite/phosphonate ABC transporter substrate-binding protein [Planctomycetota bacterium]
MYIFRSIFRILVTIAFCGNFLCGCDSGKPTPVLTGVAESGVAESGVTKSVTNPEKPVKTLTFGIVPQQSASKLARLWIPIMERVSEKAGVQLVFQTAVDIPQFEKNCRDGKYDIAYMNPFHYTQFHEAPGYIALAKQKDKKIQGILVARKDLVIDDQLKPLQGQTLAFPAPDAFAATKLPAKDLENKGIDFSRKYVSSHDSVYRSIVQGLYVAGGGIVRTFKNVDEEVSSQLKIIHRTAKYTPHAFAILPSIDLETRNRIASALIDLENSEVGLELLGSIKFAGIELAESTDWQDVRDLNLTPNELSD